MDRPGASSEHPSVPTAARVIERDGGASRYGQLVGWSDRSCGRVSNTCSTSDYRYINAGESATIQCNGVREAMWLDNTASNTCRIEMTYR